MINLLITGDRNFYGSKFVSDTLEMIVSTSYFAGHKIKVVTCSNTGADKIGQIFAISHNYEQQRLAPKWDTYSRQAGYINFQRLPLITDIGIIITNGSNEYMNKLIKTYCSTGTQGHPTIVLNYETEEIETFCM